MPKPIVFIAALLLALPAFAQTRMPARQVEADTNMVNIAVSLPFTAQVALDWIDANWPAFSSESWSNIDPAEDTVQSVFDWVDDNWPAFSSESWSNIDPAEDTVQSVFDWVDDNWQAELDDSGWGYLSPEAPATVQGTFDWIDAYAGTNGLLRGTSIFGFTFVDGVWVPPADLVGVENLAFVRDTNLTATSAWGVELVTNASWDAGTESWLDDDAGTNAVAFISHPPFVTADPAYFRVFCTNAGTFTNNEFKVVSGFETNTIDSDGAFALDNSTGVLTVGSPGLYFVSAGYSGYVKYEEGTEYDHGLYLVKTDATFPPASGYRYVSNVLDQIVAFGSFADDPVSQRAGSGLMRFSSNEAARLWCFTEHAISDDEFSIRKGIFDIRLELHRLSE